MEYKGHPIFLDVSATWCGPCLKGLKGSESLRENFKDTDVRFAVLWLLSAKDLWDKIAPTIPNSIQIFIDNPEMTDRIKKHLNVNSFPSYFMIDKEGNITREGVPCYQSQELPEFLKAYIK